MGDVDKHLQCQECSNIFLTNEALRHHLERFRDLSIRIRIWDEQCRAHIEPIIELDGEPDELDNELCHDHPALLRARICPVEGCKKRFGEKKQLNIHFESHDECQCAETCIVCGVSFSHIRKLLVHTTHPEAIPRHRSYIQMARVELRREARNKLHRMLVDASSQRSKATKRSLDETDLCQQPALKRNRVLNADSETLPSSCVQNPHDPSPLGQLTHKDPYAAPMFPSGDAPLAGIMADPYAARTYMYQGAYQEQLAGYGGFLPLTGQMDGMLDLHLSELSGNGSLPSL